ncbi:hypothetical protein B0H13DRAFT_1850715 [Mycena leptocephala]|nr:hypothetical protein B0H13DRAFT_1850715 [Mycena leptocephala]
MPRRTVERTLGFLVNTSRTDQHLQADIFQDEFEAELELNTVWTLVHESGGRPKLRSSEISLPKGLPFTRLGDIYTSPRPREGLFCTPRVEVSIERTSQGPYMATVVFPTAAEEKTVLTVTVPGTRKPEDKNLLIFSAVPTVLRADIQPQPEMGTRRPGCPCFLVPVVFMEYHAYLVCRTYANMFDSSGSDGEIAAAPVVSTQCRCRSSAGDGRVRTRSRRGTSRGIRGITPARPATLPPGGMPATGGAPPALSSHAVTRRVGEVSQVFLIPTTSAKRVVVVCTILEVLGVKYVIFRSSNVPCLRIGATFCSEDLSPLRDFIPFPSRFMYIIAILTDFIHVLTDYYADTYNVCIFAYGQTGSGKSWKMEGGGYLDKSAGVSSIIACPHEEGDSTRTGRARRKKKGSFSPHASAGSRTQDPARTVDGLLISQLRVSYTTDAYRPLFQESGTTPGGLKCLYLVETNRIQTSTKKDFQRRDCMLYQ